MNKVWKAGVVAVALVMAQAAAATDVAADAAPAADAATAADATQAAEGAPVVQVTPTGEQVVTVTTGNETVDAAANYAVKCTERAAAMKTCDSMGAFKAIACRKVAEMRYKGIECPL